MNDDHMGALDRGRSVYREVRRRWLRMIRGFGTSIALMLPALTRQLWQRRFASSDQAESWEARLLDGRLDSQLNPHRELDDELKPHLRNDVVEVRILDVGSGPITTVGMRWPGRTIALEAVDVDAERYAAVFVKHGITPPVQPRPCEAERLTELFEPDSFDLVHAENAIDHCYDPVEAIRQMVTVVKPGGRVVLRHYRREADRQHFRGLHLWNFDVSGHCATIENPAHRYDLAKALADCASVTAEIRTKESSKGAREWVYLVIEKNAS